MPVKIWRTKSKTKLTSSNVPFRIVKLYVEDSVFYAKKDGSQTPDLIIEAYKYANMSLEISRDSFAKIENAERAALSAEASAKATQESAEYAEHVSDNANAKSDNAVEIATEAKETAEQASNQVVEKMGIKVYIDSNTTP